MPVLRALLVDDEELSVRMLESIIDWSRYGIEIIAGAQSGQDALRLFHKYHPNIVITDIRMPDMDGLELLRRVKESSPETEFILVSAFADFVYAKKAIALGGADYLLKPVDEFELEKTIKKIVEKIDAHQAAQRLMETAHRQKQLHALYSYMSTGSGGISAQKSAVRLGVDFSCYALMGFMLNESSMSAYIESSLQLDTQLPYLHARLEAKLREWSDCFLFDFAEGGWIAVLLSSPCELAQHAKDMIGFIERELRLEVYVCFTEFDRGLETLPANYKLLRQLNQYSFFLGEEPVCGYGYNCQKGELDLVSLVAARKSIEAAIQERDAGKAGRILTEALDELGHAAPSSLEYVYDLCYSAVCAVRESFVSDTAQDVSAALTKITLHSLHEYATLEDLKRSMLGVFASMEREPPKHHSYSQLVQDGLRYLQENYSRNISLEEICGSLGVSRNYFCYLFKKETGNNLWAYLTETRLEKAKELLRNSGDKSYAIAYQVGYDNPSYFSKLFKKSTGMTPNEYRSSVQGKN